MVQQNHTNLRFEEESKRYGDIQAQKPIRFNKLKNQLRILSKWVKLEFRHTTLHIGLYRYTVLEKNVRKMLH